MVWGVLQLGAQRFIVLGAGARDSLVSVIGATMSYVFARFSPEFYGDCEKMYKNPTQLRVCLSCFETPGQVGLTVIPIVPVTRRVVS